MKQALVVLFLLFGFNMCSIASIPVRNATDEQTAKFLKLFGEDKVAQEQFYLFLNYLNGNGVPENKKLAFEWFRKAAEQGNIGAQRHLGYMYSKGEGVTADNKYAYAWHSVQVALDGSKYTKKQRDSVANKLSQSDLEEAQDIAIKLYDRIKSNK